MKHSHLNIRETKGTDKDLPLFPELFKEHHAWQALICEGKFTWINQQAGSRMKHSVFKKGDQRQIMGQGSWADAQGCNL